MANTHLKGKKIHFQIFAARGQKQKNCFFLFQNTSEHRVLLSYSALNPPSDDIKYLSLSCKFLPQGGFQKTILLILPILGGW